MNKLFRLILVAISCAERSHCYQPSGRRDVFCVGESMDLSQNSDCIVNLNELGVDLEKSINSKIGNRYIMSENKIKTLQLATFAAGCFWGIEESFRKIRGVKSTMVGYTGGRGANPTYRDVCTDLTGHAEAIQLQYDPQEVTYEELLKLFWSIHNPTTKNRQGPDVGSQYRSVIFYHTPEQELSARRSVEELEKSGRFRNRIVTEIVSATTFYKAEEYHQKYYQKTGGGGCYF
jgi:peptide-methionine (S)-S-oxide reductase